MNTNEVPYPVPFNGKTYHLPLWFVNQLESMFEYKGSNISITFKLKDTREIVGTILEVSPFYPLWPNDIKLPTDFKVQTSEGIEKFIFSDIDSIIINED